MNKREAMYQIFERFSDGIHALKKASYSISQAIHSDSVLEHEIITSLASNLPHRPTGNGVDWSGNFSVSAHHCAYCTTSGLRFGWTVDSDDYQSSREQEGWEGSSSNTWMFFVIHPDGTFPENSSLADSLVAEGFSFKRPFGWSLWFLG